MDFERETPWLVQFTELVDVLGRYGTPFALVILGFIVIYVSLFTGQSITTSANHFAGMIIGCAMVLFGGFWEYTKIPFKQEQEREKSRRSERRLSCYLRKFDFSQSLEALPSIS